MPANTQVMSIEEFQKVMQFNVQDENSGTLPSLLKWIAELATPEDVKILRIDMTPMGAGWGGWS